MSTTVIQVIDFLSLAAVVLAILFWQRWRRVFTSNTRIFFIAILILTLFHHVSNVLEWFGVSNILDKAEDNIEILIPLFWGFLLFSYFQDASFRNLKRAYRSSLVGWTRALDMKDKDTEGHSQRVSELSVRIAVELHFDQEQITNIYYGALLHDIGKMGIPDEILNKPGPLTPEERVIIEQHPMNAYNMLKDIEYLKEAIQIPYYHHENWDGSGYPRRISGEAIPKSARIFALVDNWDALNSDRPYRKAWKREEIVAYIKDEAGKKFDPELVPVFLKVIGEN